MSKKDYERIAKAFQDARDDMRALGDTNGERGVLSASLFVARALQEDNERFNTDRFLDACEPHS